jgi:putative CocE/NonD family hydrolase
MKKHYSSLIFTVSLIVFSLYNISCSRKIEFRIEDYYVKHQYYITMRDGVNLFTAVYSPIDRSVKYPIMMLRTPYSIAPYGVKAFPKVLGPSELIAKEKYIFVYQDVRGRFMSEGEYDNMRAYIPDKKSNKDIDESSDTYDTIDWLVKNIDDNNGKVGMWGISYPGFYAAKSLIDPHPALKAVSPQAPISDWLVGDDFHHNGAFFLSDYFHFFSAFGIKRDSLIREWPKSISPERTDGYKFYLEMGPIKNIDKKYFNGSIAYWDEFSKHPNNDKYWKSRSTIQHLKNIKPAVMVTGGWFDAEDLYGTINTYEAIVKNSPDNNNIYFVMGPWYHGGWARSSGEKLGDIEFGSNTSLYYQENFELPFFNYYLKGKGEFNISKVNVFETGSNTWQFLNQWPPQNVHEKEIYFSGNKKLEFSQPDGTPEFDEYISDPSNPVPYTSAVEFKSSHDFMDADQRFTSNRNDVLTYKTNPLENNVSISGPLTADLYVSTTGTDGDWIVKIIDVLPDNTPDQKKVKMGGYQMLVRWEIMRGKFRNSYEKPEPFLPGKVTSVKYTLPDINHTFLKGHRIMVQVQSSFFPMADRNPQIFTNIYTCDSSAFQKAIIKLYHSKQFPSGIKFNLLKDE